MGRMAPNVLAWRASFFTARLSESLGCLKQRACAKSNSSNRYGIIFLLTYESLNQEASKTHLG